jgi:hypothetical protein
MRLRAGDKVRAVADTERALPVVAVVVGLAEVVARASPEDVQPSLAVVLVLGDGRRAAQPSVVQAEGPRHSVLSSYAWVSTSPTPRISLSRRRPVSPTSVKVRERRPRLWSP